jgi:hypothetical protein
MWVLRIRGIEESPDFQGLVPGPRRGGEREMLIRLGTKKLGPPDEQVLARIAAISDPEPLHILLDRILDATTWDELLAPADQ